VPLLVGVDIVSDEPPGVIRLEVGDLVVFTAPGGVVDSGTALEPMGAFIRAIPGPDGRPLVPQGTPNAVLFRATTPGEAVLHITTGDVWVAETRYVRVRVTVR
jgi:hypothetical protein